MDGGRGSLLVLVPNRTVENVLYVVFSSSAISSPRKSLGNLSPSAFVEFLVDLFMQLDQFVFFLWRESRLVKIRVDLSNATRTSGVRGRVRRSIRVL